MLSGVSECVCVTILFPSRLTDDDSMPRATALESAAVSEFVNKIVLTLFAYTITEDVTAGSFRRWFVGSALEQTDDCLCRDAPTVVWCSRERIFCERSVLSSGIENQI